MILKYILLFFAIRSAYEVLYWLLFQFMPGKHAPAPDLKMLGTHNPEQRAILYQVFHTGVVVLALFGLFFL